MADRYIKTIELDATATGEDIKQTIKRLEDEARDYLLDIPCETITIHTDTFLTLSEYGINVTVNASVTELVQE